MLNTHPLSTKTKRIAQQTRFPTANKFWEARLPPGHKIDPASDMGKRTQFIRAKYERKLYFSQPTGAALAEPAKPALTGQAARAAARAAARKAKGTQKRAVNVGARVVWGVFWGY